MTTYTQFNTALAALSPTGVVRAYTAPPASLNTADLPAAWVSLPSGTEPPLTFQHIGGWHEMRLNYYVAIEPVPQNTQLANYAAALEMMDAVSDAINAASPLTICEGPVTYTVRVGIVPVAGVDFWAVIAEVSGSG